MHLCGLQRLIKPLLAVHKARDLSSQQPLRCVWPVPWLMHALLQGFQLSKGHEGEHAQELDDLSIAHIGQQVLVEPEGGQPICKQKGLSSQWCSAAFALFAI